MTNDRFTSRAGASGTVDRASVFPVAAKEPGVPTLGLFGVLTAAVDAALGAVRDRSTVRLLRRMSDHVLADMGLNRHSLAADVGAARKAAAAGRGGLVSQRLAAWREESRVYRELSGYTDAELAELGMGRGDVRAAARGQAVMLFRDAGLVDGYFSSDGRQSAANQPAQRRAA